MAHFWIALRLRPDGFDAAHAAPLAVGISVKTHSGLISAFGQHIIQPGLIDARHGRPLSRLTIYVSLQTISVILLAS
jgi:uncharacterized protein (UPF0332 family)